MKIGIKSEIHDCSIAIARLLAEKGILNEDLVNDISILYRKRIDKASIKRNAENAANLCLEPKK